MSTENANQSAFPAEESGTLNSSFSPGLTKREYFAAMAMQGMLANSELFKGGAKGHTSEKTIFPSYAEDAVKMADALISELNKQ